MCAGKKRVLLKKTPRLLTWGQGWRVLLSMLMTIVRFGFSDAETFPLLRHLAAVERDGVPNLNFSWVQIYWTSVLAANTLFWNDGVHKCTWPQDTHGGLSVIDCNCISWLAAMFWTPDWRKNQSFEQWESGGNIRMRTLSKWSSVPSGRN